MNSDEPPYWCAWCLTQLPIGGSEQCYCQKCGTEISTEADYLTEVQWGARVHDDHMAEVQAKRDGLIL